MSVHVRRRPSVRMWWAVVAALLVASLVPATAHGQDESDLARAREQIAAIEAELERANDVTADAQADLERAREALARVEAVVNAVAQRVTDQQDAVETAREELDRLRDQEEAVRLAIRRKAVELYKGAGSTEFTTLAHASDIQTAIDRSELLRMAGRHDTARVEDLDVATRRRAAAADLLEHEFEVLDDLLAEQETVMAEAERVRESRAVALAVAEEELSDLAAEHDELTDLEVEIERAIAARKAAEEAARKAAAEAVRSAAAGGGGSDSGGSQPAPPPPPDPPPSTGGGYSWPLCGTVTSEFGWRWGRQHAGIDIDDDRTDRITAAQAGTVIYAGYNSGGYGNLVLIEHADGVVTAYAHQRSFVVGSGQTVGRGELIGYVGSTGNSTGPHLHFETRVGGSDAVNPRQFLSGSGC